MSMPTNAMSMETLAQLSPYNYIPSFFGAVIMLSMFAISTALHVKQAIYYRVWYMWPTVILGGIGEIIGWSGRLWSSRDVLNQNPFLMQITTTIISPTFILATNFIVIGGLIRYLGPHYSRLNPRLYTLVFCSCDILALTVQALGGALASDAFSRYDVTGTNRGGHIMLAGICFQLVAIIVYVALATEFFLRLMYNKPFAKRVDKFSVTVLYPQMGVEETMMLIGTALSTLCMLIRAVYRTIELSNGWNGRIISTQLYFFILDGGMMVIAMVTINVLHPGALLKGTRPDWEDRQQEEISMENTFVEDKMMMKMMMKSNNFTRT